MANLDYVEVVGRFATVVGDTNIDVDDNPDVQWCDEGIIRFTPLLPFTRVLTSTSGPFQAGNALVEALVGSDGRLVYNGNPFVRLVDLGSEGLTPHLLRIEPSYRVDFIGVRSQGRDVRLPSFTCHPLPNAVNDLTALAPLPTRLW